MDFLTVTSIGGSTWSFRMDRIEMVSNKAHFEEAELRSIPELNGRASCAIIKLIGNNAEYYCQDSYESIMARLAGK